MTTQGAHASGSGTGPGAEPIPAPLRSRPPRRSRDEDSDSEDIDPNRLDMLLSRSVQSALPVLEPESFEHSMLRNTRVHSRSRSRHGRRRGSTASPRPGRHQSRSKSRAELGIPERVLDTIPSPSEETPLLLEASAGQEELSGEEDQAATTPVLNSPYLGGVSPTRFWLLFSQIMAGYFVACFDSTIMASSHPVITSYFGSSNSASWLSTAFLLTSTSFQPVLGSLSDALGRRTPYVVTTGIFVLGTAWCALAGSMVEFVAARALCGLGAGGMMTIGSIIVSDVVPIEIRGAYQSYMNITFGVGAMLGAALGGAMADYLGWRWEFGVQVPVLVVCFIVAILVVPDDLGLQGKEKQTLREAMRAFDYTGSILMSTAVTFLILGLNLGGNVLPWSHPLVIASLSIFAVFLPLFLFVETRAVKPIMPLHLVLKSPHLNLLFSNHIAAFLSSATVFNAPLFFQGVLLTSATTSGFRLIVSSGVASACGAATGFLITASRRLKWPIVLGTSLSVAGALCLAAMRRGWPAAAYVLCLVPGAAGSGFQFPGTFLAILAASSQREQAVVTSTLILWRSLGQVLGVACTSLVVQNALWYYLEAFVSGPEKEAVVEKVRSSVEAIKALPEEYREQVVRSYEAALGVTFACCAVLAVLSWLAVLPIKLPRLGKK